MCRKILSNYNSTAFFASVFRQEFSPRFFDSKFRQHSTNLYGNRQNFCRLLSNFVENYCRKILSKLDNIFRQDFSPAIDGIRHFSTAFDKIFCRMLSNTVWKCCRKLLSENPTALFDKFRKRSLVNLRWRLSNCVEENLLQNSTKKLKKKYLPWEVFLILFLLNL